MQINRKWISLIILVTTVTTILVLPESSLAHSLWINATDYYPGFNPKTGAKVIVYLGYGHKYPVHDFLDPEKLSEFRMLGPDSQSKNLVPGKGGFLATPVNLKKVGAYVVTAASRPGFYTMYMKNDKIIHKMGTKSGLKNVIMSLYHERYAKALISVGKTNGHAFLKPVGHRLEIIPLRNPSSLKTGDLLEFQVIFDKRPARYFKVSGTYMGFSSKGNFAYATSTDSNGMASLRILHHGPWLIKAETKLPSSGDMMDKCNEIHYSATLTFAVP